MLQKSSSTHAPRKSALPIPECYWVIPGRLLAGEYPSAAGSTERGRRRIDAFLEAGFDTFIDLTSTGETGPYEPLLREQAGYYSVQARHLRFPTGDYGLPSVDVMKAALDAIDAALAQERKLYLHCYAGIGRTGTTVGCYLVRHGHSGESALAQLARWWQQVPKHTRYPHSPETLAQEDFVRNWPERA